MGDNHKGCKIRDTEKCGEWRYMRNTRGDSTCRHETEPLYDGDIQDDSGNMTCSQPQYWCRQPDNYTVYKWSCLGEREICDNLEESIGDKDSIIFAVSVGVGLIALIFSIICITLLCKWKKNQNNQKKKEVIDDNFYYGDEGEDDDYYHQTNVVDNNDY